MSAPRTVARGAMLTALLAMTSACASHQTPSPEPMPVPQQLAVAGGSLYVDDGGRGTGIPVVFIHGNGGSSEVWRSQLDHLRNTGHRAIALDLPGFGRSTPSQTADYSLDAMAAAIDSATRRLGVNRFVIVGHSYGGAVVAKYAATHPEKIAGAVYVDAAAVALPLTPEQIAQFTGALHANKMQIVQMMFAPMLKPSSDTVRQQVFASVERTNTDVFIGALMSLTAYEPKQLMAAYTGPRMAIVATDIEQPMSFGKQFPDIETTRIAGAGHWLMLDKPAEVNAAIDSFLAKLR